MTELRSRMTWALRLVQVVMGVGETRPKIEQGMKNLIVLFCKYQVA